MTSISLRLLLCFLPASGLSYWQMPLQQENYLSAPFADTVLIIPNGKYVNGERIKAYHQKLNSFSVKEGKEEKTGTVDDTYSIVEMDGHKYALRVAKIVLPNREILDSGLVDIRTFRPVYHHSHQTTKTMLFKFNGDQVSGTVMSSGNTDLVNMQVSHPLFDSYFEELIARTIDLEDGMLFKYPDFIYEEGGLVWQSGKIEKTDSSPSGKDGWMITYTDSKSGRKTTYWIDKDRNFKQVQYQFGANTSIQRPGDEK
jgi:hypothetical protein